VLLNQCTGAFEDMSRTKELVEMGLADSAAWANAVARDGFAWPVGLAQEGVEPPHIFGEG